MRKYMKEKFNRIKGYALRVMDVVSSHHTGAYAAQAAYFFVLSMIPIILLLLTMVQFTSLTKDYIMNAVLQAFPTTVEGLIESIVDQVYSQSGTIIPITVLVALWSAGRGVLSITNGLNCVYESRETRNYVYLRIRASLYTVIFLVAIILSLALSVFGNRIAIMLNQHFPVLVRLIDTVIRSRTLITLGILTLFWDMVYKYLPNRKNIGKTTMKKQLPGAIFTACAWQVISFIFSIYLDIFTGFTTMYGSLTMIILIMLWLYMCMYVILLGGEVNALLQRAIKMFAHEKEEESSENQT
ncbi:YihY/virulence factor BrkB family protein [Firmicutes bacterium OM07-11]|nr:YihY/virulence factor BrkB family protein [Firmicutes bacterium AM41-5BH]RHV08589.1 YihY/virulence factor BrkB family protein [Firmicutes bacterium OM07-11]RKQ31092.1 YihY family inner membrane protein [Ruminococcus sp. B05]TAP34619.1 YihY/virulence factor BrkB family protein [Mediterraneibacter sp. gm002]